jgi:Flp pilus assembly protein TadD
LVCMKGNKGVALYDQGKYDEAIKCYNEVIRLDRNDAIAHYAKGVALKSLGRTSEADVAYAKAKELGYSG